MLQREGFGNSSSSRQAGRVDVEREVEHAACHVTGQLSCSI
jgi:hypothetical protein